MGLQGDLEGDLERDFQQDLIRKSQNAVKLRSSKVQVRSGSIYSSNLILLSCTVK